MSYYMADRKHRKAFLEARQSLEVKMNLEEQSQQQVRLRTWKALREGSVEPGFVLREGVCKESLLLLWLCRAGAHAAPASSRYCRLSQLGSSSSSPFPRLSCLPFSIWRRACLSLLSVYWLCSSLIHTDRWSPPILPIPM